MFHFLAAPNDVEVPPTNRLSSKDIDMYIDRPPRAGTAATWWPLSGLSKHRCGSPVINIIKAPSSAWLTKAELLSTWRTPLRRGLPSSLMAWPYRRSSLWGRTQRRGSGRSGTWSVERMTSSSPPIPNQVPEILSLKIIKNQTILSIRHLLQRDKYEFICLILPWRSWRRANTHGTTHKF